MKLKIFVLGMIAALQVEAVDYKHCQQNWGAYFGQGPGYPFEIKKDGTISPHASVNYKNENGVETIVIPNSNEPSPFGVSDQSFIIERDDDGNISKITNRSKYEAPPIQKTETGIGAKNRVPGVGIGYGGFGPYANFGNPYLSRSSSYELITDINIVNDKCVPSRTYSVMENDTHIHRSLIQDSELCHDILKMKEEEEKEGSRLSALKSCYNDYKNEVKKIIDSHKQRNDDLYNPQSEKETTGTEGLSRFPGYNAYSSSFGAGGFGGSVDTIVSNDQTSLSTKNEMLRVYCGAQSFSSKELFTDSSLYDSPAPTPQADGARSIAPSLAR